AWARRRHPPRAPHTLRGAAASWRLRRSWGAVALGSAASPPAAIGAAPARSFVTRPLLATGIARPLRRRRGALARRLRGGSRALVARRGFRGWRLRTRRLRGRPAELFAARHRRPRLFTRPRPRSGPLDAARARGPGVTRRAQRRIGPWPARTAAGPLAPDLRAPSHRQER